MSTEKAKASTTLPGKVEKVINPHPHSGEPEKAQIAVEGADHLYREIRVPNRLVDGDGHKVKLKKGPKLTSRSRRIRSSPIRLAETKAALPSGHPFKGSPFSDAIPDALIVQAL